MKHNFARAPVEISGFGWANFYKLLLFVEKVRCEAWREKKKTKKLTVQSLAAGRVEHGSSLLESVSRKRGKGADRWVDDTRSRKESCSSRAGETVVRLCRPVFVQRRNLGDEVQSRNATTTRYSGRLKSQSGVQIIASGRVCISRYLLRNGRSPEQTTA